MSFRTVEYPKGVVDPGVENLGGDFGVGDRSGQLQVRHQNAEEGGTLARSRHAPSLTLQDSRRWPCITHLGGVPELIQAVQNESLSIHQMFGAAYDALARSSDALNESDRALAAQVVEKAGWTDARSDAPVLDQLAGLLGVLNDLGWPFDLPNAATYLGLIDAIAAYEVSRLTAAELQADRDAVVQQMVIGQVVFGQLLLNLRRLAHEHHCALRFNEHVDIEK